MRAANLRVAYCQSADNKDFTAQKKWDGELQEYRSATAQGIRPDGTKTPQIRHAVEQSEKVGAGYGTPEYKTKVMNTVLERTRN
jgi:hypothetical protein